MKVRVRLIYYAVPVLLVSLAIFVGIRLLTGPLIGLEELANGFEAPLGLENAGDGSGRLFVVDKLGQVYIIADGQVLADPFLDLSETITTDYERGLLGLAFDPDYITNGLFYVNYTDLEGDTVIAQYRVSDDPNRAEPDSEMIFLRIDQPASNHNGGQLAFGPDGYLYIGLGDGGGGTTTHINSQRMDTLLGKMNRIDVRNTDQADGLPYDIPSDNPFLDDPRARPEIWALGLRNPWRYSFDPLTGDLYIADVGETHYEELDYQPAPDLGGQNYGWPLMEGLHCGDPAAGCEQEGLSLPVIEYSHEDGNQAIIGGYVYRGMAIPELRDAFLFADYGSGRIWATSPQRGWRMQMLLDTHLKITAFGYDDSGELYVVDIRGGAVYRIVALTLWQRLFPAGH